MDLKQFLIPTKESRNGTFFAILLAVIAVRSLFDVITQDMDSTSWILIGITAILTATYGLLRFVEVFNTPGLSVRYFVRSVNISFMALIIMGELFYEEMMGQIILLISLLAIEFNLISIYAEYTGRLHRTKIFLMRLLHIKPKFVRPPNIRRVESKWDVWAWTRDFFERQENSKKVKRLDPLHEFKERLARERK